MEDCLLEAELEAEEWSLLAAPVGQLTTQQTINACWRSEGMAVLSWALGAVPLPTYDQVVESPIVARDLGLLQPRDQTAVEAPVLRSAAEFGQLAETMKSLHWRLREFSLRPQAINWVDVARQAWWGPLDTSELRLNSNDLEVGNQPIEQADQEQLQTTLSIALERHVAILWLLGEDALYSEVTPNT